MRGAGEAWLRCPWAVVGPGRASRRRAELNISDQAPLVWRAPEGPEGLAAVPVGGGGAWPGFEATRRAAGSRVAISRAGRRPPAHTAAGPHSRGLRRPEHPWHTQSSPQELGGVTIHGSVGRERNPVIPRASAMSEAQRAPGTPRDDPINETTSSVDQPRPRRSERVTAPSRLASRAPEGASARGTCAYVGSGAPSRWAS